MAILNMRHIFNLVLKNYYDTKYVPIIAIQIKTTIYMYKT